MALSRTLISMAVAATSCLALPAHALGRLADVNIVDRQTGQPIPVHEYHGEYWIAGQPRAGYAIDVRNLQGRRIMAVMSVDGVNVITGQTASTRQDGYVLSPWQQAHITGWRKNLNEVATFYFTTPERSYASRTGRPDDVGVIGVAIFEEKRPDRSPPPVPSVPAPYGKSMESSRSSANDTAAARAPAPGAAPSLRHEEVAGQALGTGHGEREASQVSTTHFTRASSVPAEVIRIRYDSYANLRARGIIREHAPRQHPPHAFPKDNTGFVPDPPQ